MSAIDPDLADKIYAAIADIREYLPAVEALSEFVPVIGDELVRGEKFLDKLFELVSTLQSHPTVELAAKTLQDETLARWKKD